MNILAKLFPYSTGHGIADVIVLLLGLAVIYWLCTMFFPASALRIVQVVLVVIAFLAMLGLLVGCADTTVKYSAEAKTRVGTFRFDGKEVIGDDHWSKRPAEGPDTSQKFDQNGHPNFGPSPTPTPPAKKAWWQW